MQMTYIFPCAYVDKLWERSARDFITSEIARGNAELVEAISILKQYRIKSSKCRSQAEEKKSETSDEEYFSSFDHTTSTEDFDSDSARSSLSPSEEAELLAHSLELGDYNAVEPNTVVEVQPGTNLITPEEAELVSQAIQIDEQTAEEPRKMNNKWLRSQRMPVSTDFMVEPYAYASTSSRRAPTYQAPIKSKSKTWNTIVNALPFKSLGQSSWFSPKH